MTDSSGDGTHMDRPEQRWIDSELRTLFRASVQPGLSLQFNLRLRNTLAAEKHRQRESRRRTLVMQIYWLAAAVASIVVMLLIRWPDTVPPALEVCVAGALLITILISPLLLLLRRRSGLGTLIFSTSCVNLAWDNKKTEKTK